MYVNDRWRKQGQERPANDVRAEVLVSLSHTETEEGRRIMLLFRPTNEDSSMRFHIRISRAEALVVSDELRQRATIKLQSEIDQEGGRQ